MLFKEAGAAVTSRDYLRLDILKIEFVTLQPFLVLNHELLELEGSAWLRLPFLRRIFRNVAH